jgi:multiple sugar transport system substrate-binding protein
LTRKMKSSLIFLVILTLVVLPLAGCGGNADTKTSTDENEVVDVAKGILPQKYKGTSINILAINPAIGKMAPEFEKATGIKVNIISLGYSEIHDKLSLDFAAKKGDIDGFSYPYQWYGEFVRAQDAVLPLDELAKKPGFPDLVLDDYVPAALDNYGKYDGKLIGLPIVADVEILVYNKKMFEEAGIKEPPKTWDEVVQVGKKLTKDTDGDGRIDQYGFGLMGGRGPQAAGTFTNLYYAHGGTVGYFDEKMKPQLDSLAGEKALTLMAKDLKAIAPPDSNTWDSAEMENAFSQGKVAMGLIWPGGASSAVDPSKSKVVDDVGFACSPNNSSLLGGWAMGISKYSKNPEATYLFISWLTHPETQIKYAKAGGTPARESTLHNEELVKIYPWFPAVAENLALAKPFSKLPESEELIRYMLEEANDAVTGIKTPEKAAKDLNNRAEKLMKDHGYYKK